MKYVWQRLNKANHNHYICEIEDTLNKHPNPIYSRYFDGTQSQALTFFMRDTKVKQYLQKDAERYVISMRANSIQLNWKDD